MPNIAEFPRFINEHAKSVVTTAVGAVKSSAKAGSDFMRDVIASGASTGTEWHRNKNLLNGYEVGARIGSKIAIGRYGPSRNPGNMLRSVGVSEPSQNGETVNIRFGWVNSQESYFAQQDMGTYKDGGTGMGLLNGVEGARGLSAALHAEVHLIKLMKAARFKVSGGALS
jgi:hypothetical protein